MGTFFQLSVCFRFEIPMEEQKAMGLTDGLIRFSIGLDNDIERTYQDMKYCLESLGVLTLVKT